MKKIFLLLLVGLMFTLFSAEGRAAPGSTQANAHDFSFKSIDGEQLPLSSYRGKAVMIVNTASRCGFTKQYSALQEVWEQYRDRGLVVLGVPSGDFGNQELATEKQIKNFCSVNFNIDFPMTEKTSVSGENAHEFYKWARDSLGGIAKPRWNFHKYLIDPRGNLVDWFSSPTSPTSTKVRRAIESFLPQRQSLR
jgi:glutathione peroxidase